MEPLVVNPGEIGIVSDSNRSIYSPEITHELGLFILEREASGGVRGIANIPESFNQGSVFHDYSEMVRDLASNFKKPVAGLSYFRNTMGKDNIMYNSLASKVYNLLIENNIPVTFIENSYTSPLGNSSGVKSLILTPKELRIIYRSNNGRYTPSDIFHKNLEEIASSTIHTISEY